MWKDNLVPYSYQKRDIYYFSRRVLQNVNQVLRQERNQPIQQCCYPID